MQGNVDFVPFEGDGGDATLTVQLRDETGNPIEDAVVTLIPGNRVGQAGATPGSYTFAGVSPGTYTVSVRVDGFEDMRPEAVTVVSGETFDAMFELEAVAGCEGGETLPGSLTIVVESARTGARITDATVTLDGTGLSETNNVDGVYTFPTLQPNTYDVTIEAPGLQTTTQTATVECGEAAQAAAALANTQPEIALAGDAIITIDVGATFEDPGATATDAEDGDITESIVVGGDAVDTSAPGTFTITYNVTDSRGFAAEQQTRMVMVGMKAGCVGCSSQNKDVRAFGGELLTLLATLLILATAHATRTRRAN